MMRAGECTRYDPASCDRFHQLDHRMIMIRIRVIWHGTRRQEALARADSFFQPLLQRLYILIEGVRHRLHLSSYSAKAVTDSWA
jgi:hypothetical protein